MKTVIALLFLSLVAVSAMCPNSCSGHGSCGANDKCSCYKNYLGIDCALRRCKYAISWVDTPSANDVGHAYAECSNKGICDRKSGTCKCFPGYEGEACRRTTCPNLCSGHGTCEFIDELADDTAIQVGGAAGRTYGLWDSQKIQGCKCDPTWAGSDCSERMCLQGDDPLTTTNTNKEIQTVTLGDGDAGTAITGYFTLQFTDLYNAVWTSRPMAATDGSTSTINLDAAALEMKRTLEDLPNQAINSVAVTAAASGTDSVYTITFQGLNLGNQNTLVCNTAGCDTNGCQPRYTGVGGGAKVACTVATTQEGNHDIAVCSNRGECDSATGLCTCHSGYYGESCQTQTVLL